jgi:hypothetical protein
LQGHVCARDRAYLSDTQVMHGQKGHGGQNGQKGLRLHANSLNANENAREIPIEGARSPL